MFLRSFKRYLATVPFLLLAACSHAEQKVEHPVPVASKAPELFTPTVEHTDRAHYALDCVLWNSKLPHEESLVALVHDTRDGQRWLTRLKNFPEGKYPQVVEQMLLKGQPVEETILDHDGWLAICQSDAPRYEPPFIRSASL